MALCVGHWWSIFLACARLRILSPAPQSQKAKDRNLCITFIDGCASYLPHILTVFFYTTIWVLCGQKRLNYDLYSSHAKYFLALLCLLCLSVSEVLCAVQVYSCSNFRCALVSFQ